jgi:hypothetical protein
MATKINAQDCYLGFSKPKITVDDLQAGNFQGPQKLAVAANMQTAFDFYLRAHEAARNFGADKRYDPKTPRHIIDAIDAVRTKMSQDLRRAADTGLFQRQMRGGHLKWAFQHLESTGGRWTDTYMDGWNQLTMPSSIVNFMEQVEAAQGAFSAEKYSEWQTLQQRIKMLKKLGDWEKMGTEIGYAKQAFELATPKLWAYLGASEKAAAAAGATGGKWLGYGASLHTYSSLYLNLRYNKAGAKEAMVAEAAAMVVEQLPIFGKLYGDVIRGIPGLVSWFKAYGEKNRAAINGVFR